MAARVPAAMRFRVLQQLHEWTDEVLSAGELRGQSIVAHEWQAVQRQRVRARQFQLSHQLRRTEFRRHRDPTLRGFIIAEYVQRRRIRYLLARPPRPILRPKLRREGLSSPPVRWTYRTSARPSHGKVHYQSDE